MSSHYFFDLTVGDQRICDEHGVQSSNFLEILLDLHDVLSEIPQEEQDWRGWSLEVVDHSGRKVLSVLLDGRHDNLAPA